MSELVCSFNKFIFWSGFIKGAFLVFAIWGGLEIYKYFKKPSLNQKRRR